MTWDPIQNLDSVDVTAERLDGGVDLIITVSTQLMNTTEHRGLVTRKIDTYVEAIHTEEFREEFGTGKVRILFWYDVEPDPDVRAWVESLIEPTKKRGAELVVCSSLPPYD